MDMACLLMDRGKEAVNLVKSSCMNECGARGVGVERKNFRSDLKTDSQVVLWNWK